MIGGAKRLFEACSAVLPNHQKTISKAAVLLPADALQPLTHRDRNGGRHALPGQFGQFLYQSVRFLVLVADCSSQSICTRQKLAAFALNLRCRLTRTTYELIFGAKRERDFQATRSGWAFHLMSVIRSGWPKPSLSVSSAFPAMLQIGGIYSPPIRLRTAHPASGPARGGTGLPANGLLSK